MGSIRSPLWRHGGTVHGPQPRSYEYAFPKKKLLGALRSALAAKAADGKLTVVSDFNVKEAKTKAFRASRDKLNVEKTALLVDSLGESSKNLELASRNLKGVELVAGNEVHPYHLLRYDRVQGLSFGLGYRLRAPFARFANLYATARYGLSDDRVHSPNEKFDLDNFQAGMRTAAHLWQELA